MSPYLLEPGLKITNNYFFSSIRTITVGFGISPNQHDFVLVDLFIKNHHRWRISLRPENVLTNIFIMYKIVFGKNSKIQGKRYRHL